MASPVEICNLALYMVGSERISSLTQDIKRAKICNDLYEVIRDSFLGSHPWNFATRRVELAKTATTPEFGYEYEYQLPADCLRVVCLEHDDIEFKVEGDKLLSDEATIKMEYIAKEEDGSKYPSYFIDALSAKLAVKLSYPLVQSRELKLELRDNARELLSAARLFDAQEGTPRDLIKSDWTDSRFE